MTMQKILGKGFRIGWHQGMTDASGPPTFSTGLLIDASGEKAAFVGRFWHKDGTSKTVDRVVFRFGAVTKGGTTDIQVSLQNVSTTTAFPDESVDQSGLVGNANIVANTGLETTLSSTRTLAPGDLFAVVFEYSTFNASDAIVISSQTGPLVDTTLQQTYTALKAGAGPTWTNAASSAPLLALHCDDGTYGTMFGGQCHTTITTMTFNSGSVSDEMAMCINLPFPIITDGGTILIDMDADFDFVLYDGTSAMANGTISADKDNRRATSALYCDIPFGGHITLAANHDYFLSIKPTTVSSVNTYVLDYLSTAIMACAPGGALFCEAVRVDAGAWSKTTTRQLVAGLWAIGFDDGVSGSGPLIGPGRLVRN